MENIAICYICDKQQCTNCTYPECRHTTDPKHALNYKDKYIWQPDLKTNFEKHEIGTGNNYMEIYFEKENTI